MRASLQQVYDKLRYACSMSRKEVEKFKQGVVYDDELNDYCFKSVYVFELLHNGYGFGMNDYVTFAEVVNGQKVGWPLGAMLYEINTLPWVYVTTILAPHPPDPWCCLDTACKCFKRSRAE